MPWKDDSWNKAWTTGSVPDDFDSPLQRRALPRPLTFAPPPHAGRAKDTRQMRPGAGSFIVDAAGTILAFDRQMERLTGWNALDVVGRSRDLGRYDPPDDQGIHGFKTRPLFEGDLPEAEGSTTAQLVLHRKDGAQLDVEAAVTPLAGQSGRKVVDIQKVMARSGVPSQAPTAEKLDPLTNLPDRFAFHSQLRQHFESARSGGHPLSVLLVDIDDLRALNEEQGHERGDHVLRQVAGILAASVRQNDFVARLEQDNFGLLLAATGRGDARHVGGRIRKAIECFRFSHPGGESLPVSVSIGVASFPADAEAPDELVRRANDALIEARRLGCNRVWSYVRRPRVRVAVPVYFDGPSAHLLGTSRDLSNSGILVETGDELPAGMRVGLAFQLPGQFDPVHVIGRVARSIARGNGGASRVGLGIEFERYTDRDRWALESFLHESREQGKPASAE